MTAEEIQARLAEPFGPDDLRWKPQAVSGNRALAVAYVSARAIQDRLDDVLGVDGWQDTYQLLPDGAVVCTLGVRIDGRVIEKQDVGSPSEQPDSGDRMKAAFSDALKRAAVKFGIGRYLYRLPKQWADYDAQRKQFTRTPALPDWARPRGQEPARTATQPANGSHQTAQAASGPPTTGKDLYSRIVSAQLKLVEKGLCPPGALLEFVQKAAAAGGEKRPVHEWSGQAVQLGYESAQTFIRDCQERAKAG